MKFSIGQRLFAAVLCAALVIAAAGIELTRWTLFDNFSDATSTFDRRQLDGLVDVLTERYREAKGWSFLPTDATARRRWLAETWALAPQTGDAAKSPTLGARLGLVDRDERYLAGTLANPAVVALANVDTLRRTLIVDGVAVGHLVVATPQNRDDELAVAFLLDRQNRLLAIGALGLLAIACVAAALAAHFRRPIRKLVAGARRLERGEFDARLNLRRGDELGELAAAFDHLAARLDEAEQARRRWIADTSHELRTPLAVLQAQLEAVEDGVRSATPDNVALMLRQTRALAQLVEDLHQLARADAGQLALELSHCDAWTLLQQTFADFAPRFAAAGLDATLGERPLRTHVRADAARLRQVFANLLENCVRHTDRPGRVAVNGHEVGGMIEIHFEDSAPGVADADRARLGERFFRVDTSRDRRSGGTGLGLALSRQIVVAHGGWLQFSPSSLGGLNVIVSLPLVPAA